MLGIHIHCPRTHCMPCKIPTYDSLLTYHYLRLPKHYLLVGLPFKQSSHLFSACAHIACIGKCLRINFLLSTYQSIKIIHTTYYPLLTTYYVWVYQDNVGRPHLLLAHTLHVLQNAYLLLTTY